MQPATTESGTRTVIAGAIGNILEWYDFALFGFFAPIIAPLFFPADDHLASLLAAYGVFALGFLMRPIGGALFGHIGDRLGRKRALQWSVLLMAGPTTLLGLLPTYAQIGLAAPILLTLLRMLQGLSVGGEFIGSISFLSEHAAEGRRGFLGSWSTCSGGFGNLLGSGMATLVLWLVPADDRAAWGWRLPFLGGVAIGLLGMWLRRGVHESVCFQKAREAGDTVKAPLLMALRRDRAAMLLTAGLAQMMGVGFYLPWVWLSSWLSRINAPQLPLPEALTINTIAMLVMIALIPAAGALSDRWGRKPVIVTGCVVLTLLSYPLFVVLSGGQEWLDLQALLVIAVCGALCCGALPAAFVELFPTETRYSGIALAYNGTQAVLGGTTPFVATWLIRATGDVRAPAFYLMAAAAVTGIAALCMTERSRLPLR